MLLAPCAAVAVVAMLLLGGPMGHALSSIHGPVRLLPDLRPFVLAKYGEQARYLIALAVPLLLAGMTLALTRRRKRPISVLTRTLTRACQLAGLAFVGVCVWVQHTFAYGPSYGFSPPTYPHGFIQPYFTSRTLLVGAGLAGVMVLAVRTRRPRYLRVLSLANRPRGPAAIGTAVAVGMTAIWMLAGVNLEHTILDAGAFSSFNQGLPLDEVFAVLDGRSPLVNFIPQYGALWPYPIALAMSLLGTSFGAFSVAMCTATGLSLLAIFSVLRRITGSSLIALVFYLPFLATSLFAMEPGLVHRAGPLTLYSVFPLRYAGPYILLWCVARWLDGDRPHGRWTLFTVAGLVLLNNAEFGVAALGATFAATLLLEAPLKLTGVRSLVRDALIGLLATYALVSILTLLRAGSLPQIGQIFFYPRIYGGAQFNLLPTPTLGLHLVFYLTFVAAIVLAAIRAIRRSPGRLMTGALVWSGVFGLGAGSYFMGRSHPEVLVSMFSAWSLSLALLAVATVQQITRDPARRVTVAHLTVFLGLGVAACSLAQTPLPWTQIQRLQRRSRPIYLASSQLKQTLLQYGGHKPEAIMSIAGHRLAYEMGIENVSPYDGIVVTLTEEQVETLFQALKAAGGKLLVLPDGETVGNVYAAACNAGFSYIKPVEVTSVTTGQPGVVTLWSAPTPGVAPRPCPIG